MLPSFSQFIKVALKAALSNISQFTKKFDNLDFQSPLAIMFSPNGEDIPLVQHMATYVKTILYQLRVGNTVSKHK